MPIIIKKGARGLPVPAPVVEETVPAPLAVPPEARRTPGLLRIPSKKPAGPRPPHPQEHKPLTKEESLAYWKKQPPIGAKPTQCLFCEQWYLMPCSETQAPMCGNYLHLHRKSA